MGSDLLEHVREHALRVARDRGWVVLASDCSIEHVQPTPGSVASTQVLYWEVKVKIRAALNKHRPLAKDGHLSGMVRLSGDSLLDTLAESPHALHARRASDGEL